MVLTLQAEEGYSYKRREPHCDCLMIRGRNNCSSFQASHSGSVVLCSKHQLLKWALCRCCLCGAAAGATRWQNVQITSDFKQKKRTNDQLWSIDSKWSLKLCLNPCGFVAPRSRKADWKADWKPLACSYQLPVSRGEHIFWMPIIFFTSTTNKHCGAEKNKRKSCPLSQLKHGQGRICVCALRASLAFVFRPSHSLERTICAG